MEREELASWLRLRLTPGVGNDAARKLMAAFGPPERIFSTPASALREFAGPTLATALAQVPAGVQGHVDASLAWLRRPAAGVRRQVLHLADADYPRALLNIEDPPLVLYVMGQTGSGWPRSIAIVGSRNPTPQGLSNAHQFASALAQSGLVVVSGLALGVDAAAHEGALEGAAADQLATIAVVGTGIDRVYPRQNQELSDRIGERGLIVSEYLLGTPPLAANFPRRNRIISGLSEGTLVVEAALQSGSLITARMAAEQGKEVFAIPGSIHSTQSRGCHELLRQGAKLVASAQDVLEELLPGLAAAPRSGRQFAAADAPPDPAAGRLLELLGFDPVSLDTLVDRSGTSTAELQARLLELELSGHVARLPGGLFQRTAIG